MTPFKRFGLILMIAARLAASQTPEQMRSDSVARAAAAAAIGPLADSVRGAAAHHDSVRRAAAARADSAYVRLLEGVNQQLTDRWTFASSVFTLVALVVAIGTVAVTVVVYAQGREFRERMATAHKTLDETSTALDLAKNHVSETQTTLDSARQSITETQSTLDASRQQVTDLTRQLSDNLKESADLIEAIKQGTAAILNPFRESRQSDIGAVVADEVARMIELQQRLRTRPPSPLSTPAISRVVHFRSGTWEVTGMQSARFQLEGPGVTLQGTIGDFNQQLVGPRRPETPISFDLDSYGFNVSVADAMIGSDNYPKMTIRGHIITKGDSQVWQKGMQVARSGFVMAGVIEGFRTDLGGYADEHPPQYRIRFSAAGLAIAEIAPSSDVEGNPIWVSKMTYHLSPQAPRLAGEVA